MVAAAFDKEAFPTFGNSQPGSYSQIHQQLKQAHPQPSVTWEEMQSSLTRVDSGPASGDQAGRSRLPAKVRKDPELIKRAMLFLGIVGEVLCPGSEQPGSVLSGRVFLRPQWLVDVMKEFVRHDLRAQLESVHAAQTTDPIQVKVLGELFCSKGVLDRQLLPWLWRNLPFQLAENPEEIDFMLALLTELGVLTLLPHQQEPLWMLPLRLRLLLRPRKS